MTQNRVRVKCSAANQNRELSERSYFSLSRTQRIYFRIPFIPRACLDKQVLPFNLLSCSFLISFPPLSICTFLHKRASSPPVYLSLSHSRGTSRSIVPSLSHFRWRSTAWAASWQYLPTLGQRVSPRACRSARGTTRGSSSPPSWLGNHGNSCTCGSSYSFREGERSSPSTASPTPPHISTQVRQRHWAITVITVGRHSVTLGQATQATL